ncbi:MAG: bifunctional 5,10-methylenetetrahydrofolate dehydrogenase/5,10-methenyltetrahydrofolate cyclohydrolase [Syntrophomonadaceae bacterium]|nr:bifunctional 5,10-methylenetetrahydrofolate dehydrogenase/5,10-methenyltetrahydrofolate cyclohydrolase [Syntrophomonadaceae bacterium]
MEIIRGSNISEEIRKGLKEANQEEGICPKLAIILVGGSKEDVTYVRLKERAADSIGGKAQIIQLSADIGKEELLDEIAVLNQDENIDGILLQLPLPERLEPYRDDFLAAIRTDKDVDGFNPINRGKLVGGHPKFTSCAALACLEVIKRYISPVRGKKAILVGDSFDLIIPLAVILLQKGCHVTVIPEYRPQYISGADILVLENGAPGAVKGEYITERTLIIDAGFYWQPEGVCGNVDQESMKDINCCLLPVPGGLGPILIAKLMENLCIAARARGS